jgi:hypothetical protein
MHPPLKGGARPPQPAARGVMAGALGLIIFAQPFAQTVCFHPNDRIPLRVEIRGLPQRVDCDVVFLDLVASSFEVFGANVG